jgi:hypothetical protein
MQHVIKTQKKVIYFNKKQVLEDFNNRRVWRWNCSLTTDLVMTVVVDYQAKPGTCQYDLMVRGLPFRKWAKRSNTAAQLAPSRYSQPAPQGFPRAPMGQQATRWGAGGAQQQAAPAQSFPRAPAAKAQPRAQPRAPAPQPKQPEVSLIDWGAEETTSSPAQDATPLNIFDPLAGAGSPAGGDDTGYTDYEYCETEDGGILALNSDLASLSWGNEAEQAEEEADAGLSVESGEASGFSFISDAQAEAEPQMPSEECLVPTDAWDAGSSLVDLNLNSPAAGSAAGGPGSPGGALAFTNSGGGGAGSGFNFIDQNTGTGVSDAAKKSLKPSAFYDPFAGMN